MYVTGRRMFLGMVVFTLLFFAASRRTASAQGLIWKLPAEEKCTVVFEGKLKQTEKTDDAGPPIIWSRKLIIKSLKKMKGYYDNKEVDCRLLEISVITGENIDGQIETGPAGKRIYKILVPESKIVGDTVDADKIFVSMIPIARNRKGEIMGIRKIGNAKQQRIKSPALQVYPILTLLRHYRTQKTLRPCSPSALRKRRSRFRPANTGKSKPVTSCKAVRRLPPTRRRFTWWIRSTSPSGWRVGT